MTSSLNKRLFIRLLLASMAISVVFAGVVLLYELSRVNDRIVAIAVQESNVFLESLEVDLADQSSNKNTAVADELNRLSRTRKDSPFGHFILSEVYDRDENQIANTNEEGTRAIEELLDSEPHAFPAAGDIWHKKALYKGGIYVQALVPLVETSGNLVGYFEGVYKIAPQIVDEIETALLTTLVMVTAVVLATSLVLYPLILSLNRDLLTRSRLLLNSNLNALEVLGAAIAKRDSETRAHSYRVVIFAVRLAEAVGIGTQAMRRLIKGAFLHDVGKIAISDTILLKPDKLDEAESEIMKSHVLEGIDIIANSEWLREAGEIIRYHHERYDGTGFMEGLQGEDIPLGARIFAIADVFDALTSKRPYKEPYPLEEAVRILEQGRGSHFDPALLDIFLGIVGRLNREIAELETKQGVEAEARALTRQYFTI